MSKSWTRNAILIVVAAILIGAASWAFYSIINQGAKDILSYFSVTNIYVQAGIVILFVVVLLTLLGFGFSKTIKKIIVK